jgi:hypothetical protein
MPIRAPASVSQLRSIRRVTQTVTETVQTNAKDNVINLYKRCFNCRTAARISNKIRSQSRSHTLLDSVNLIPLVKPVPIVPDSFQPNASADPTPFHT